jgi:hypothetical protein
MSLPFLRWIILSFFVRKVKIMGVSLPFVILLFIPRVKYIQEMFTSLSHPSPAQHFSWFLLSEKGTVFHTSTR